MTGFSYNDIIAQLRTASDAQHLLSEVEMLLNHLFQLQMKPAHELLTNDVSHAFATVINQSMQANGVTMDNPQMVKEYLTGLKQTIQKLKVMRLTLAFKPSSQTIALFSSRIRAELNLPVLLEIQYDPSIIGGAVIIYRGVYENLSLKRLVENVFAKRRDAVMMLLQ